MSKGGKRAGSGRKPLPRLSPDEFNMMVQAQDRMCALCSDPGSIGGLVVDVDGLNKTIRGLVHPKCKAFLALGRDNPHRFQMAISYLGKTARQ
jgi:Recombination endonuclease VII